MEELTTKIEEWLFAEKGRYVVLDGEEGSLRVKDTETDKLYSIHVRECE